MFTRRVYDIPIEISDDPDWEITLAISGLSVAVIDAPDKAYTIGHADDPRLVVLHLPPDEDAAGAPSPKEAVDRFLASVRNRDPVQFLRSLRIPWLEPRDDLNADEKSFLSGFRRALEGACHEMAGQMAEISRRLPNRIQDPDDVIEEFLRPVFAKILREHPGIQCAPGQRARTSHRRRGRIHHLS